MQAQRLILLTTSAALMVLGTVPAMGQKFPNKPIRIITSGVGGGNDITARLVAHGLTDSLGQQVIVENRGSSVVPGETVSKAAPDGYTLLLGTNSLWTGALLRKTPYDPIKDFAPVAEAVSFPTIMAVSGTLPVNSVKDFIAMAKAKPGALNYMMTTTGGSAHLASELFKTLAGVNLTAISYKDTGTGIVDLIAGRVHLFFSAAGAVMTHARAGRLKALGITTAKPSALFPELPTVASVVPGYEIGASYCIFAPAKTPAAIITLLNKEIVRTLTTPEAKENFAKNGLEVVAGTPEALAALRKADVARVSKVIKDAGIPVEK